MGFSILVNIYLKEINIYFLLEKLRIKIKTFMKKITDFTKKYKVHILSGLLFIVMVGSCSKSSEIKKLNRTIKTKENVIDSLNNIMVIKQKKIDSFPEKLRLEQINIHMGYDNWISSKNRGSQLMELHSVVKYNIKNLRK